MEQSIQDKEYFNLGVKNAQEEQEEEKFVAKSQINQQEEEEMNRQRGKVSISCLVVRPGQIKGVSSHYIHDEYVLQLHIECATTISHHTPIHTPILLQSMQKWKKAVKPFRNLLTQFSHLKT